jgi:hypothetical protein
MYVCVYVCIYVCMCVDIGKNLEGNYCRELFFGSLSK